MSASNAPASALPSPTVPLPTQPPGVSWPTLAWATGDPVTGDGDRLETLLDRAFGHNPNPALGLTLGFVAVQGGRIVAERYSRSTRSTTRLISWSTAKSITHAALGILLRDGRVDLDARPVAPEWADGADPRHAIGLRDLLAMRSGLRFNEDYVDADTSHCLDMLYGTGAHDVAGYAASQPLEHPVGSVWNYSSGTTNIISRLIGTTVGGGRDGMERFLHDELFGPIGMSSAEPRFDEAGTWVGSSYLYATARDFARFGYLYLRDGVWDGRRILPEGWVDDARTPTSPDGEGHYYGHQWWVAGDERGQFSANGYEGQRIVVVPALDLVVVRLGKSPVEHAPALADWLREVIASFEA
jgi:CubicO group peptidase (beta-lactamase class C family)